MKLSNVIMLADLLTPNAVPVELKVHYLNEVEGMVATEALLLSTADVPVYTADDLDAEMLVKPPHDKLYVDYLAAMLHFANGEYDKYANVLERFNASYREFHRFVFNTMHPADGIAVREMYYVSAYAIAVAYGYEGTEDEFGKLLQTAGAKGDDGIGIERIEQVTASTVDGGINVWRAYLTDGTTYDYEVRNGSKGDKGDSGADGVGIASVEQTVTSAVDGGTNEVTVTLTDGSRSKFYVKNGSRGSSGGSGGGTGGGADGVGIASVDQTVKSTEDGGMNEVTVTLTDGSAYSFNVYNGSKGSPGYTPQKGVDYFDGENGITPHIGDNGNWWIGTTDTGVPAAGTGNGGTDGSGAAMELLWENQTPVGSLGFKTVNLSNAKHSKLYIVFNTYDDWDSPVAFMSSMTVDAYAWTLLPDVIDQGTETPLEKQYEAQFTHVNTQYAAMCRRPFTLNLNDSGNVESVVFFSGQYINLAQAADGWNVNDQALIPVCIYGLD